MKRLISAVFCVMLFSTVSWAQSVGRIFLTHEGNGTFFNGKDMESALRQAVAGDTIYLGEGPIAGDFTIDKPITIIGSGQQTVIQGKIDVVIPNNPNLESTLLWGVDVTGSVTFKSPVTNLVLRQCKFEKELKLDEGVEIFGGLIENCFITDLKADKDDRDVIVLNSWIHSIHYNATYYSFVNCNIGDFPKYWDEDGFEGECVNCIVAEPGKANASATFINCYYFNSEGYSQFINCWKHSSNFGASAVFDLTTGECKLGETNDKIGTDGTIIGFHGGPKPYTLDTPLPKVAEISADVDNESRKMNVTVKVNAQ